MKIQTVNPANESPLETYESHTATEVDKIVGHTREAFTCWRNSKMATRSAALRALSGLLRESQQSLAQLITREMGKPITEARAEIEKCAVVCEYYAENASAFMADENITTEASPRAFISFEPLGIVCAVMPWNFPFWQVFRFAVPALAAGNAGLLKHASNTTGCALAIEQLFLRAGFPENLLRTLLLDHDQLAELVQRQEIAAVTLTGSTEAGRKIAQLAGKALKKSVLELGGSDPYLILEDADIENAAQICAKSRLINGGQSCIAAKRFIVVDAVRKDFEAAFVEQMRLVQPEEPGQQSCKLGPLARADLREGLHKQVLKSQAEGARCILGGELPSGTGFYYAPTVLTNVEPTCTAFREELFGPVAAIIPAQNEQQAIELANDSVFGLGAAVFTRDRERGERIARQLDAGTCVVNDFVRSDPEMPFGGIKQSGWGRELSHYGIKEFVNIKSIRVS